MLLRDPTSSELNMAKQILKTPGIIDSFLSIFILWSRYGGSRLYSMAPCFRVLNEIWILMSENIRVIQFIDLDRFQTVKERTFHAICPNGRSY